MFSSTFALLIFTNNFSNSQNFIYNDKYLTPSYTVLLVIFCFLQSINFLEAQSKSELFTVIERPINLTDEQNEMLAKIKNYEHLKSVTYVKIGDISSIIRDRRNIAFMLPNDTIYLNTTFNRLEIKEDSSYVAAGLFDEYIGHLLLIKEKGLTFGTIHFHKRTYQIFGITANLSVVLEFSEDSSNRQCGTQTIQSESENSVSNNINSSSVSSSPEAIVPCAQGGIDILALYTSAAKRFDVNVEQTIRSAVEQFNTSVNNSGISPHAYISLVGTMLYDLPNDRNPIPQKQIITDLNNFQRLQNQPNSLRESKNADIAVLFTHESYPTFNGRFLGLSAKIDAESSTAYSIVQVDDVIKEFTFPHEVGHLLGANHQGSGGTTWNPSDGFEFSITVQPKWWQFFKEPSKAFFGTIMCEPNNFTYIPHFSNPAVSFRNSPTGSASCCNVASIINSKYEKFSNFRDRNDFQVWIDGTTDVTNFGAISWEPQIYCGSGPFTTTWQVTNYFGSTIQQTVANDGKLTLYFYPQGGNSYRGYMYIYVTVRGADGRVAHSNLSVLVDIPPYLMSQNVNKASTTQTFFKDNLTLGILSPNPADNSAFIDFNLKQSTKIKMLLVDIYGKELLRFIDGGIEAGYHRKKLDLTTLPSGIYILRTVSTDGMISKKIIISH